MEDDQADTLITPEMIAAGQAAIDPIDYGLLDAPLSIAHFRHTGGGYRKRSRNVGLLNDASVNLPDQLGQNFVVS